MGNVPESNFGSRTKTFFVGHMGTQSKGGSESRSVHGETVVNEKEYDEAGKASLGTGFQGPGRHEECPN